MFVILFGKQKSIFFFFVISTLALEIPEVSIFIEIQFQSIFVF